MIRTDGLVSLQSCQSCCTIIKDSCSITFRTNSGTTCSCHPVLAHAGDERDKHCPRASRIHCAQAIKQSMTYEFQSRFSRCLQRTQAQGTACRVARLSACIGTCLKLAPKCVGTCQWPCMRLQQSSRQSCICKTTTSKAHD